MQDEMCLSTLTTSGFFSFLFSSFLVKCRLSRVARWGGEGKIQGNVTIEPVRRCCNCVIYYHRDRMQALLRQFNSNSINYHFLLSRLCELIDLQSLDLQRVEKVSQSWLLTLFLALEFSTTQFFNVKIVFLWKISIVQCHLPSPLQAKQSNCRKFIFFVILLSSLRFSRNFFFSSSFFLLCFLCVCIVWGWQLALVKWKSLMGLNFMR